MKELKGRVAVVTGGAAGIGLGLSKRFLEEGMKVVIADIDQAEMDKAVASLSSLGEVIAVKTDVTKPEQIQALADAAVAKFGAVHVLCNNAGVGGFQRFSTTSRETWKWIVDVDMWGVIDGCRIFLPILEKQDEAHIVNTASMAALDYGIYNHPYNVAKAGVAALSEGLWREFKAEKPHIGISYVCPSFTNTSINKDERNAPPGHTRRIDSDPDLEGMRNMVFGFLERGKQPAEIADYVVNGIRNRTLAIFPHPEYLIMVKKRFEALMTGGDLPEIDDSIFAPYLPKS